VKEGQLRTVQSHEEATSTVEASFTHKRDTESLGGEGTDRSISCSIVPELFIAIDQSILNQAVCLSFSDNDLL
jgi:hypothetical protein